MQFGPVVSFGSAEELDSDSNAQLLEILKSMGPWRKGPFEIFGNLIRAHWDCDAKWRLVRDVANISGKRVCDIGCGNGYYLYRMVEAGAASVLGVDPVDAFADVVSFLNELHPVKEIRFLTDGYASVREAFDVIYCMGVFYHQRNPVDLLQHINDCMEKNGVLILETMGLPEGDQMLVPASRYGGFSGVWHLPGPGAVMNLLNRTGYKQVELVNTRSGLEEQTRTQWADIATMAEGVRNGKTIEGYPAPVRHIFRALKK